MEKPEIVMIMVPVSQSAAVDSNTSFICTATGNPKPTITWKKENDSNALQPVVVEHFRLFARGAFRLSIIH